MVVFVSIIVFAATSYPHAKLSFSGIKLVSNNSTTQGFVDVALKDVNTTAVSFCIKYDKNYIELSDVTTNTPIDNPTSTVARIGYSYNTQHTYFEQNTEAFPGRNFVDIQQGLVGVGVPIIGIADADNGVAIMNFLPQEDPLNPTDYIGIASDKNELTNIMAKG